VSGDLGTICGMIHILQSRGHIVWVRLWETPYLVPASGDTRSWCPSN